MSTSGMPPCPDLVFVIDRERYLLLKFLILSLLTVTVSISRFEKWTVTVIVKIFLILRKLSVTVTQKVHHGP